MQYALHLQNDRVDAECIGGENRFKQRCYYWGTGCLNREYPVARKCGAATQINDFLSVFSLAGLCVCITKYIAWKSYSLNTCLQTELCCFWIVCAFLLLKLWVNPMSLCSLVLLSLHSILLIPGRGAGAAGAGVCHSIPDYRGSKASSQWSSREQ